MNILAIETTGSKPSVAFIRDNEEVVVIFAEEELNHLQNLIPMIDDLMEKAGVNLSEITVIAVSIGPGSFTGIRIGISTAKALAQVLDLKIVPVPTLLSMAYSLKNRPERRIICPMIDARRGQVYGGAFVFENGMLLEIIKCECIMKEELVEKIHKYEKESGFEVIFIDESVKSASLICELGLDVFREKGANSLYEIRPEYMRISEAEQKLIEKESK